MTDHTPTDSPDAPQGQPAPPQQPQPPQPQYEQAQQSAPPPWAKPMQLVTSETEPLEYHRLLRGVANYRWWKPLLLLLVAGAYFGVFSIVVALVFTPIIMVFDPLYITQVAEGSVEVLDTQRPVSLVLAFASIIVMIPAVLLAMLTLGMRPVGRVWSITGRIRWGLMLRLFGAGVLAVIVMNGVGIGVGILMELGAGTAAVVPEETSFNAQAALISLALIILFVPFQSIAEEVAFRGLFMQVIGAWLKNPWWAILIPTLLFAAGHIYDLWGLSAVALLGGLAGWLTWRTGGLEAAMAIHVANNLIVFSLMTSGQFGSTAQTSEGGGAASLIGEIVGLGLYLWLVLRIFDRGGYSRTRIDVVEQYVPIENTAGGRHD